ncbi:MAG: TetR/AcrR family transcriptional regulator [Candidatus Tectomicrobia bacterium]|uniref:TetR/AcrR family transcriptional regulator n=1 Tax=Tectimicrobiota bacterium TaxID=2528274 RepID=A0A932FX59_UNCTE|nr:TetR/AcrR family transcriptional regulator [Candidatus Tectomicrobia bacterium]
MAGKREEILEVAARLIHYRGFNHTSLDQILQESKVTKNLFYYHFKSKEELGMAILDYQAERAQAQLFGPALQGEGDPHQRIFRLLDRVLEAAQASDCRGGCPIGNLALELSDIHEGFRQRTQEIFGRLASQIETVLEELRAAGRLQEGVEPKELALFILANLQGARLLGKTYRAPQVLATCFERLKDHLNQLFGIGAGQAPESPRRGGESPSVSQNPA